MPTLITQGSTVIAPQLIDGYESANEQRNLIHPVLGRSSPAVSFRPANLRTGTLRLIFAGGTVGEDVYAVVDGYLTLVTVGSGEAEDLSLDAVEAHNAGGVFTLSGDERSSIAMTYVPTGAAKRMLDDATREVWIVTVDYQEVD